MRSKPTRHCDIKLLSTTHTAYAVQIQNDQAKNVQHTGSNVVTHRSQPRTLAIQCKCTHRVGLKQAMGFNFSRLSAWHTFSAFWLRSSVVSVLISVKTDIPIIDW